MEEKSNICGLLCFVILGNPWRRKWQCTPVLLPGKSHEQRDLVGYSPYGHKDLDMTEQLSFKKGKTATEMQKRSVQCTQKVL